MTMPSPLQGYNLISTLALSVLLSLSAVKNIEASAGVPPLNTFPASGESSSSSITSYSYAYEPPLPDDKTRAVRLWGSLPATYVGKVAAFGNALTDPFAANLMLPPDDPWLCEFPESLQNSTSFVTNNQIPYKIALFVSMNGCSAEQKARVALEIRQKVTPRLELLILYSTTPSDDTELVSLPLDPDSPWQGGLNLDGEGNLGILHVPQRYAAGIDVRIRVNTNSRNADPRMGMPTNEDWKLEVEIAPLSMLLNDDGYPPASRGSGGGSSGGSGGSGSYRHDDDFDAGSMYWFRIVLFTLLIVSPCCRAGYLWHAGGGRFHWRRNDNGRIVGILYVPPIPAWLSTGGMHYPQDTRVCKLTIEQFNTLPQIKYKPNPRSASHDDGDDHGGDGDDDDDDIGAPVDENNTAPAAIGNEVETNNSENNTTIKKKDSSSDVGESSSTSDDEFPTLAQNTTEVTEADSMETAEIEAPAACETDSHESTADALELGDGAAAAELQDKEKEATKASVPEASASAAAASDTTGNSSSADNNIQVECAESCSQANCPNKFKATTSSMCSICIDDFEEGETLVLLPRCQHAFHKDCILPWLTERQGCCPMCKCNVLEEDDEEDEEEGEQARNASNEDDDSDSTENNANERVVPPGPPEQSGTR